MLTNVDNNCDVYISLTNIGERLIYVFLRRMSVKKRRKSINLSLELNLIEREGEREKFLLTILNEALWISREEKAGNAISNVDVHQMQS